MHIIGELFLILIVLGFYAFIIYVLILLVKSLRKYLKETPSKSEKANIRNTLGERLKDQRVQNNMTQEFVAEYAGVSRQAVSKWENGSSDPSTSNLFTLAKLFEVDVEALIKNIV